MLQRLDFKKSELEKHQPGEENEDCEAEHVPR